MRETPNLRPPVAADPVTADPSAATLAPAAAVADTAARRAAQWYRGHRPCDASLTLAMQHLATLADTLATVDALARRAADKPRYRASVGDVRDDAAAVATDTLTRRVARYAEGAALVAVMTGGQVDHLAALTAATDLWVTPRTLAALALSSAATAARQATRRPDRASAAPVADSDSGPDLDADGSPRDDSDSGDTVTVADLLAAAPASITRAAPFHSGDLLAVAARSGWQVAGDRAAAVLARLDPVTLTGGRTVATDTLTRVAVMRPDKSAPTVGAASDTLASARAADTAMLTVHADLADLYAWHLADETPAPQCGPCRGTGRITRRGPRKGQQCNRCDGTGAAPYADTLTAILAIGPVADTLYHLTPCGPCGATGFTPAGRQCGPCQGVGQVAPYHPEHLAYVARSGRLKVATLDTARKVDMATLSSLARVPSSQWGQVARAVGAIRGQVVRARAAVLDPGAAPCSHCGGRGDDGAAVAIGAAVAALLQPGRPVPVQHLWPLTCDHCDGSGFGPVSLDYADPFSRVHSARVAVARADDDRAALAHSGDSDRAARFRGVRPFPFRAQVFGTGPQVGANLATARANLASAYAASDAWSARAATLASLAAHCRFAARVTARDANRANLARSAPGTAPDALTAAVLAAVATDRAARAARAASDSDRADRAATDHARAALARPAVTRGNGNSDYRGHPGDSDSGGPVAAVTLWGQQVADHLADHLATLANTTGPQVDSDRAARAAAADDRVTRRAAQVRADRAAARARARGQGPQSGQGPQVPTRTAALALSAERAAVIAARVAVRAARWGRLADRASADPVRAARWRALADTAAATVADLSAEGPTT